jgi:predicted CoA-substrate-specific enzyme activase
MAWFAGIDVGSQATKAVVIDEKNEVVGLGLFPSGADFEKAAHRSYEQALASANLVQNQVIFVMATGYGRSNVDFSQRSRTEIDCHARGAYHHFPQKITIVDIGGQDNKVIQLDESGRRQSFSMNRKCAAGTGSFLEEMALRLKIPMAQFSELAEKSTDRSVKIGSFCTVFAMTEILSKIRSGVKAEDLAWAALDSVARRVLESQTFTGKVVATGGVVAHHPVMKTILAKTLNTEVCFPPHPQHTGALGAALLSARIVQEGE